MLGSPMILPKRGTLEARLTSRKPVWEYPAVPVDEPGVQRVGFPGYWRLRVWWRVRRQWSSKTLLLMRQSRGKSSSLEVRQKLVVMTLSVQIR